MKAVTLYADWNPKEGFKLGEKDIDKDLTYLGSQVWRKPLIKVEEKPKPEIASPTQVIIKVKACGICGSDVHMAQQDKDGYIFYPGLTAFPCTLGHEFSGIVVESGKDAINKRTGKRFANGEPVTAEEMFWCAECRPCCDGYPNHCERLQELGFSIDGAMAEFVRVDSRYLWSLEPLKRMFAGEDIFLAGSLTEPTSVAYNAVIERGGGIRPGDNAVILGGGPIGLAACAVLKRAGAARVILSEPSKQRAQIGEIVGATHLINPLEEKNVAERILEITEGQGAKIYLEATGLFSRVWPAIEECIWKGRQINSMIVLVARAPEKVKVTPEVFEVRRAGIVGSQGHSGHGTFPRVIEMMASGMDVTKLITKKIGLEEVPENLELLQTDKENCKITVIP